MSFSKILVGIDDSPFSLHAAKVGYTLAQELKAELALVHVIDRAFETGGIDAGHFPNEIRYQAHEQGKKLIAQTLAILGHPIPSALEKTSSTPVREFIYEGNPTQKILETAIAWEATILVLGTHGKQGALRTLLMGSVAEYAIRHSKIPVLIVPLDK